MSALAAVARGYQLLGRELVDGWATYVKNVNAKAGAPGYTANALVADTVEGARLTAWTWFSLASEALDAIAILSDTTAGAILSEPFESPLPGASLALVGDLVDIEDKILPVSGVTLVPQPLPTGRTQFRLSVDGEAWPSGVYEGEVIASLPGASSQTVTVEIEIG